jgi:hypothetical protein
MHHRPNKCRTDPHVRIEYPVSFIGKRKNATFNEFNRKLAGMDGLLGMVGLYIWNVPYGFFPILCHNFPYIGWILAKRISRGFTLIGTFEMTFTGILGWNSNRVKVENISIRFCKPENCFIST